MTTLTPSRLEPRSVNYAVTILSENAANETGKERWRFRGLTASRILGAIRLFNAPPVSELINLAKPS